MSLIARISRLHSVGEFRRVARLRLDEAKRAVEGGDRLIGIYLAGYSAEMVLKAAYFQVIGRLADDPIDLADLQRAKARAKTLGVTWSGNLHDLAGWISLIIEERKGFATSLPVASASRFSSQVNRIADNWREDLRYHGNRPRPVEVAATFEAVKWLVANQAQLVR